MRARQARACQTLMSCPITQHAAVQAAKILQPGNRAQTDDLRHLLRRIVQHTLLLHVYVQQPRRTGDHQLLPLKVRNGRFAAISRNLQWYLSISYNIVKIRAATSIHLETFSSGPLCRVASCNTRHSSRQFNLRPKARPDGIRMVFADGTIFTIGCSL